MGRHWAVTRVEHLTSTSTLGCGTRRLLMWGGASRDGQPQVLPTSSVTIVSPPPSLLSVYLVGLVPIKQGCPHRTDPPRSSRALRWCIVPPVVGCWGRTPASHTPR